MSQLIVSTPTAPLRGIIEVPGDKSISHRALLFAALAEGKSEFRNWLPAGDTLATLDVVRNLGVEVDASKENPHAWILKVGGVGLDGLQSPDSPLNCANAGTCMRLLSGIMAAQPFPSVLDGSSQLRARPMKRIIEPLSQMGASIISNSGRAPLHFKPAQLNGVQYDMPVASAQVKSAIILAGLWAEGDTSVHQPHLSRDHTERMLEAMGAPVEVDGNWITLRMDRAPITGSLGRLSLKPLNMDIPGDFSSAAFPLVAAAIIPGSSVTLKNVGLNSTRSGLLDILKAMTGDLTSKHLIEAAGEPVASVSLDYSALTGTAVSGSQVVRAIDEIPIWAVAAAQAKGTSRLRDAAELRVKEVDRLTLLAQELGKLGAQIAERSDGLDITGPASLVGAQVSSHGDHRLAMALAVAALSARGTTIINHADCIADSFPGFVETMQLLGANIRLTE